MPCWQIGLYQRKKQSSFGGSYWQYLHVLLIITAGGKTCALCMEWLKASVWYWCCFSHKSKMRHHIGCYKKSTSQPAQCGMSHMVCPVLGELWGFVSVWVQNRTLKINYSLDQWHCSSNKDLGGLICLGGLVWVFLVCFTAAERDQNKRPAVQGSCIPSKSLLCKVELKSSSP